MALARTEIEVTVVGADVAEAQLRAVAAADGSVASSASAAATALSKQEQATQRSTRALQEQERAIRQTTNAFGSVVTETLRFDSIMNTWVTESTKVAQSTTQAGASVARFGAQAAEAVQQTSGAKVAMEGLGKAFAALSRAAAILPGFGIAGLLLAIGEGAKAAWDAMSGLGDSTRSTSIEMQYQAALAREHAQYLDQQAEAARRAGLAMTEMGEAFLSAQTGVSMGAGGRGYMLSAIVGDELQQVREDKGKLREAAAQLKKDRDALMRDFEAAALDYEGTMAGPAIRAALDKRAADIAEQARRIKQVGDSLRDREVDLMRAARGALGGRDEGTGGAKAAARPQTLGEIVGAVAGAKSPRREMEAEALRGLDAMSAAMVPEPDPEAWARFTAPYRDAWDQITAGAQLAYDTIGDIMSQPIEASPFDGMLQSIEAAFTGLTAAASNVGAVIGQVAGTVSNSFGAMITNLITSGDAGAKQIKRAIGNALAALSAQALGNSIYLSAMGTAAIILGGTLLGTSAPQYYAAAGVMAAMGGTLALAARALGAGKVGGASASGGGGGGNRGGERTPSAADTGPTGRASDRAPQPVVVYIGEDVVTRGVTQATRRQDMRGGISEPRLAVAV